MDEAEVCDRVAIMDEGEIVELDTPIKLKEKLTKNNVTFKAEKTKEAIVEVKKILKNTKVTKKGETITVELNVGVSVTDFITKFNKSFKHPIQDLNIIRPSMDDVFLQTVSKTKSNKSDRNEESIKKEKELEKLTSKQKIKAFFIKTPEQKEKRRIDKEEIKDSNIETKKRIKENKVLFKEEKNTSKVEGKKGYEGQIKGISMHVVFIREMVNYFKTGELFMSLVYPIMMLSLFGLIGASASIPGGQQISFSEAVAAIVPGTIGVMAISYGMYYGITFIMDINSGYMREMLVAPIRR
jgi:ABC-type multidrug transport system fused ATPase/permease subunit